MDKKLVIEDIDVLLNDDRLNCLEKIDVLKTFNKQVHEFIENSGVLHSSKLQGINDILKYIEKSKEDLGDG